MTATTVTFPTLLWVLPLVVMVTAAWLVLTYPYAERVILWIHRKLWPDVWTCTSVSARWCPIHGDCTCADNPENQDSWGGPLDLDESDCPLHGRTSTHAEGEVADA